MVSKSKIKLIEHLRHIGHLSTTQAEAQRTQFYRREQHTLGHNTIWEALTWPDSKDVDQAYDPSFDPVKTISKDPPKDKYGRVAVDATKKSGYTHITEHKDKYCREPGYWQQKDREKS